MLAGKHTQASTNKPLSAGLQPTNPAQPSCRSVKAELSWRLHTECPAAIPWLSPPCQAQGGSQLLPTCVQSGYECLITASKGQRERYVKVTDLCKLREAGWLELAVCKQPFHLATVSAGRRLCAAGIAARLRSASWKIFILHQKGRRHTEDPAQTAPLHAANSNAHIEPSCRSPHFSPFCLLHP